MDVQLCNSSEGGRAGSPVAAAAGRGIQLTKYDELPEEGGDNHGSPGVSSSRARVDTQQQQDGGPQPRRNHDQSFQLIWRKLAFEAPVSTYDNVTAKAKSFLRSLSRDDSKRASYGADCRALGRPVASGKRVIFKNLNGHFKSGQLTAILGPSGAGKTTLLNAICGRTKNYRGQIRLIGASKRQHHMRISTIPQKDYLIEQLSVKENLMYSSKILHPHKKFDHEGNVMRVVRMLNLDSCYHSRASSISGGEYKRVSIAQELLKQPDILILDEPTSGLDSLNCKQLVRSLNHLIKVARNEGGTMKPIAIVMTIHQPDVEVFHLFDHVYCMASAGRVIFDGRPREALQVIQTHANIAGELASENLHQINPANLLIEIASGHIYGPEAIDRLARVQLEQSERLFAAIAPAHNDNNNLCSSVAGGNKLAGSLGSMTTCSSQANIIVSVQQQQQQDVDSLQRGGSGNGQLIRDKRLIHRDDHAGKFWYYTRLLTKREFNSTLNDPFMTIVTLAFHLLLPMGMWAVYSPSIGKHHGCPRIQRELYLVSIASNKTAHMLEEIQEQLTDALECSYMYFIVMYSFNMCALALNALSFPLSMHILLKEIRNGWYNMPCYVIAKTLANFPFVVLFPVMSFVMIYWLLDMPGSPYHWRMWAMIGVVTFVSLISTTQGLILGALFMDSVQSAIFLACSLPLPQALTSGFCARVYLMAKPLQWISWFSTYTYSSKLTTIIRFGFGICPCTEATDEYLRTKRPEIKDLDEHLERIFVDVLLNDYPDELTGPANGSALADNSAAAATTDSPGMTMIPGVDYNFSIPMRERYSLLKAMEAGESNLFESMADMMSRAFSFGHKLDGCHAVRSEEAITKGTPPDEYLPLLFLGMLNLLIMFNIILFVTMKININSRL